MRLLNIPTWLYRLLKIALLIGLTIPLFIWGNQLLSMAEKDEQAIVKSVLNDVTQAERKIASYLPSQSKASTTNSHNKPHVDGGSYISGIDVSHYQGVINWPKVATTDAKFVYVKATGGNTFVDPEFEHNWHGIRTTNLYRGAYHFFFAADDAQTQAAHFIKTVGKLREHDLPPVLDVEISDHVSADALEKGVLNWLEAVKEATGRTPIIYTDNGFADSVITDERFSEYPLWIADYADQIHSLPKPWKREGWVFWQYSEKGEVDGVEGDVDMDRFNGNMQELSKFIAESRVDR